MKSSTETPLSASPLDEVRSSATGSYVPLVMAKRERKKNSKGRTVSLDPDRQVAHIRAAHARGGVSRLLKDVNFDQILTARLTYVGSSLTTTIAGDFIATPMISASQVRTLTSEFTSYNLRYDLYRVIALRMHFAPSTRVNTTTVAPPSSLWVSQFSEGTPPTTKNDVMSSAGWETKNTTTPWSYDIVPSNNSDAWLWTGTGTSVSLTADYGIVMCVAFGGLGTATALTFGSYCVEVVCQFTRRD